MLRGLVIRMPKKPVPQYVVRGLNVGLVRHPLGVYNTPHGAVPSTLHVMRHNADFTGEKYRDIARAGGREGGRRA